MNAAGTYIVNSIFMVKFSLNQVEMNQQFLFYLASILARPIHHHGPEWPDGEWPITYSQVYTSINDSSKLQTLSINH